MTIFKEADGVYSWRKILTAIVALIFATACIGYLITHNFDELPVSYWGTIAGVFAFYFMKETLRNVKFGVNKSGN